ncbi:MAG: noncanonical pyrimidine nucleotidase, YjjG family [Chitinophagaceae bacterium]|nr:noncanonical pyrimidine nucleotidase, YjjG family [Chitinophagaceae bacterium]
MKYKHLFFDLDHTLWDFEANSRLTLNEMHETMNLGSLGVNDFDHFHKSYLLHNDKLWDRYRKGFIKVDELRWKRFWLTLLEFKIGNETLAREMAVKFLDLLPTRTLLFPNTTEVLDWLVEKGYDLHLITNGFEKTQHSKLRHAGIDKYFVEVITSEGSNSLKPHKEIFDYAIQKAKADPLRSIMIGDDPEVDIKGAMNSGIDAIFVNYLGKKIDFKPTFTITALNELKEIL